jgi:phospholipase C
LKIISDNHAKTSKNFSAVVLAFLLATTTLAACANTTTTPSSSANPSGSTNSQLQNGDIHKIKHIVVIMQENRSFDSYFGTYPGADGIPMQNGVPTMCVNDPLTGKCERPYHDAQDLNHGGPHGAPNAIADIDQGKLCQSR